MKYEYPKVEKTSFVEDFHGQQIHDPYSCLEEPDAEITKKFVTEQNEVFQVTIIFLMLISYTILLNFLKFYSEISFWLARLEIKYQSKNNRDVEL